MQSEVAETFAAADDERVRAIDEEARPVLATHESVEKAHGRIEKRRVRVASCLAWLLSFARWKDLGYVVEVRRERTNVVTGKTSTETVYYVGSGPPPPAERVAQLVRGHWGIENELHWVLDMAFGEDQARHRAKNTAANLTTLRHFALSTVKQDQTRKLGVANSRKRAGFDRKYLIHLIRGGAA